MINTRRACRSAAGVASLSMGQKNGPDLLAHSSMSNAGRLRPLSPSVPLLRPPTEGMEGQTATPSFKSVIPGPPHQIPGLPHQSESKHGVNEGETTISGSGSHNEALPGHLRCRTARRVEQQAEACAAAECDTCSRSGRNELSDWPIIRTARRVCSGRSESARCALIASSDRAFKLVSKTSFWRTLWS